MTTTRAFGRITTIRVPWPTNPAGEVALNMGVFGPHYTIGAACAAGNAGLIQGAQMLRLGECDLAVSGGVSESIHTFGIFASFQPGALASHEDPTQASRPFDVDRGDCRSPKAAACWHVGAAGRCQAARSSNLWRIGWLRHEYQGHLTFLFFPILCGRRSA